MQDTYNDYNSYDKNENAGKNKPYVARKSALQAFTGWTVLLTILLFWLIVPIVVLVFKIITVKHEYLEFHQNKVIVHKGWLSRHEKEIALVGINAINVDQTFFGRIFKYGNINIDVIGKHDIVFDHIKKPYELKKFLENQIDRASNTTQGVVFG